MEKISVETVQREMSLQARVLRKDWGALEPEGEASAVGGNRRRASPGE